jgi:acyl-coenzyme A synthetase/AMP-(fatty) acid ligase
LPLFESDASRPIAWRDGRIVPIVEFQRHVAAIAQALPPRGEMIDLCEDRYWFIASYAAALSRGHTILLPPSRVEQVVREVEAANPESYRIDDAFIERICREAGADSCEPSILQDAIAMVGYTSGSTGTPQANPKHWRGLRESTARNAAMIRCAVNAAAEDVLWIVATVPPQHMYGMELSVLLPLLDRMAVHAGRPLFPADIARALAEVAAPRVLVSTPVHLRALVDATQGFPDVAAVVSATAPLDQALAQAVEQKLRAPLLEMFGSTETCVIATRRTAVKDRWQAYDGVKLEPSEHNTRVNAPWFTNPVVLQDVIERFGAHEFVVRGRNADMIEVAGKRASLADLTRRVMAIKGVKDAAVFQPEPTQAGGISRVAALVVAPTLTVREILDQLMASVDPAFLPRPLVLVDGLPRNEVGKLPRDKLLAALRKKEGVSG